MRGWSSLSKQHLLHEGLFVERGRDAGQEGWELPLGTAGEPSTRRGSTKSGRGLCTGPALSSNSNRGCQELCQGAEGINSALSSCSERICLGVHGAVCTPVLGAGEKSALGFPPGHLTDPVELQVPGSLLLKGWGFGGGDRAGSLHPTINNESEEQLCSRE